MEYDNTYIEASTKEPCWICDELTDRVDLDFETRLCSEQCSKRMWTLYLLCNTQRDEFLDLDWHFYDELD